MRRVNVNIFPKDGYFFKEPDGTIIRATNNWRGVIARVVAYRRRNKLPPGNPVEEVNTQACERNPEACQDNRDPVTVAALRVATMKGRVLAWMAGVRARRNHQPLAFVSEATMRARADVCVTCPAHASVGGGCGACKRAIREVRGDLLGGLPIDSRVSGCSILDEDCAVNTWLDDQTTDNPALPACCWRRRSAP